MIECPWCHHDIEIKNSRCPRCHRKLYEVSEDDFPVTDTALDGHESETETEADADTGERAASAVEDIIAENFKCSKCSGLDCSVQEVAMTGTGFSKLLDIQHHHYLFVSCEYCGFVEVYDPDVLRSKKSGALGTIMDTLFG